MRTSLVAVVDSVAEEATGLCNVTSTAIGAASTRVKTLLFAIKTSKAEKFSGLPVTIRP